MTKGTILEQIKSLVELQKVDAEIYSLNKDLKEKPSYLEELAAQFEGKKMKMKELEEKYKGLQVARKTHEMDLQSKEDSIAKANTHLSLLKTNKEYTAKITEIESIKADKSMIEEKILESYDEADALKGCIDQEKEVLVKEEKVYLEGKRKMEETIKNIKERISILETQRGQILPKVDSGVLGRYEKILVNKEGLAIVPVQNNACGGCYMNTPAQVINEIKMHENFVYCEMCARILFLEEDV